MKVLKSVQACASVFTCTQKVVEIVHNVSSVRNSFNGHRHSGRPVDCLHFKTKERRNTGCGFLETNKQTIKNPPAFTEDKKFCQILGTRTQEVNISCACDDCWTSYCIVQAPPPLCSWPVTGMNNSQSFFYHSDWPLTWSRDDASWKWVVSTCYKVSPWLKEVLASGLSILEDVRICFLWNWKFEDMSECLCENWTPASYEHDATALFFFYDLASFSLMFFNLLLHRTCK